MAFRHVIADSDGKLRRNLGKSIVTPSAQVAVTSPSILRKGLGQSSPVETIQYVETQKTTAIRKGLGKVGSSSFSGDIKTLLQARILIGYSGDSLSNDMGGLTGVTTTATVSNAQVKLGANALSFNGSQNQALSFRLNETLRLSKRFSISCWARFNSFNYGGPFASWDANSLASGQLNLLNEVGTTPSLFKWYVSGSSFYSLAFGSGAIVANQWYWFLCELDRDNLTAKIYLDNTLKNSVILSNGFILNTGVDTFGLGGYQNAFGGITNMNGYLDEFCILFGNTTQEERDWLWNSGAGNSLV